MTRKLLILLFFLITVSALSQNLDWKTNITDAITASNEQRKPMLLFFTAAGVSEALQNEVFKTPDFEKWSRKNVILVKIDLSDSSIDNDTREQNLRLKNAFGVENIPEVCFANGVVRKGKTSFNTLGKMSYNSAGAKAWISDSNLIINPD